jgi:hypothetical protein
MSAIIPYSIQRVSDVLYKVAGNDQYGKPQSFQFAVDYTLYPENLDTSDPLFSVRSHSSPDYVQDELFSGRILVQLARIIESSVHDSISDLQKVDSEENEFSPGIIQGVRYEYPNKYIVSLMDVLGNKTDLICRIVEAEITRDRSVFGAIKIQSEPTISTSFTILESLILGFYERRDQSKRFAHGEIDWFEKEL